MKYSTMALPTLCMASFIRFGLKSKKIKTKVLLGIFLYNARYEICYLSSFIGAFMGLTSSTNELLNLPRDSESYRVMSHFMGIVKNSDEDFGNKEIYQYLFSLKNEGLEEVAGGEDISEVSHAKYVANDYFIRNRHKYMIDDDDASKEFQIFNSYNQDYYELKYFDSFLTRFLYYNTVTKMQIYKRRYLRLSE
jgi:hypothetical protein